MMHKAFCESKIRFVDIPSHEIYDELEKFMSNGFSVSISNTLSNTIRRGNVI